MDDEKLIEYVRQHKELYDLSSRRYMDVAWKTKLWKEIAKSLKQDPVRVKKRWESLRGQYRKFTRVNSEAQTTNFRFSCEMEFLRPYLKTKNQQSINSSSNSLQDIFTDEDDDSINFEENEMLIKTSPEIPTTSTQIPWENTDFPVADNATETSSSLVYETEPRKRKREEEEDEIDHFFAAMKGSFRKFSEFEQLQAKQQIFNVITNIETERYKQRYDT